MKTNLYVALDLQKSVDSGSVEPSPSLIGCFVAPNDGMAIRDNLIPLIKIIHVEKDVQILHVGTIDLVTGECVSCAPREVSHDAYKMPETPTKNETISDSLEAKKAFLR